MTAGIVTGLRAMADRAEPREDRPKTKWLKLAAGETKTIRFLQELDESSENYNPEAGLGVMAKEWRDPNDFRKRILDTGEKCWPAERRAAGDKDWRPRTSLYINVLTEGEDGTPEVVILNQGFGPKSIVPWLIEYATDAGSITNMKFKIKRTGSGMEDTAYTLMPAGTPTDPIDASEYELYDFEKVLNHVPYEEQAAFFGYEEADEESDEGDSDDDSIWGD